MLNRIIRYFLENRVVTLLLLVLIIVWGISTSPFNWHGGIIPRNPIPVDAIPDIGDNQQIVATEWMGRSPKDIQDQITYPLTTSLLGIPGVKTIRSSSMFGANTSRYRSGCHKNDTQSRPLLPICRKIFGNTGSHYTRLRRMGIIFRQSYTLWSTRSRRTISDAIQTGR